MLTQTTSQVYSNTPFTRPKLCNQVFFTIPFYLLHYYAVFLTSQLSLYLHIFYMFFSLGAFLPKTPKMKVKIIVCYKFILILLKFLFICYTSTVRLQQIIMIQPFLSSIQTINFTNPKIFNSGFFTILNKKTRTRTIK